MIPLAAVLALALAAGPSPSPRRTGQDVSNVARARAGLLPRKPARATRTELRAGYRVLRVPSPTFLPEPAPVPEDAPAADDAVAEVGPGEDAPVADAAPGEERRAAPLENVSLVVAAPEPGASPPEEPVPVRAPEPIEEPLVAARGPTVTRSLRGSVGASPLAAEEIAAADGRAPDAAAPTPDGLGLVQASADGVVTEVTLSLRFDP